MYNKRFYGVSPRTIGGFFEDALHHGWNQVNEEIGFTSVPVNIQETEHSYELHVVAPGMKKEDFKINLDKNLLHISYEHVQENKEQPASGKWIRTEYRTKSFKRTFTLNEKVDTGKISAKYADGILVVSLPKKEVTEPATQEIVIN